MLRLIKNLSENFINNMKWYDIRLLKLTVVVFSLLAAKYFNILLHAQWYWYVLLLLVLAPAFIILLLKKFNRVTWVVFISTFLLFGGRIVKLK